MLLLNEIDPWLPRVVCVWLLLEEEVSDEVKGGYGVDVVDDVDEAVVTRVFEQAGLVVVVPVDRLVLLAAACKADARLLIRCEVLAVPFCNFIGLFADRVVVTVRLLCDDVTWLLLDKFDAFELLVPPLIVELVAVLLLLLTLLLVWLTPAAGVTVDNCNCINIIWSPNRIVRFKGALPDRKSFTCESLRLSKACITLCSGRCAWNNEKRDN